MSVYLVLQNPNDINDIPTEQLFENWSNTTLQFVKNDDTPRELVIRIVDPEESAQLNETYRHKKGPTNILSFCYEAINEEDSAALGDLAICAELVNKEAAEQEKSVEAHWAHLTIHGILHLLGFDHVTETEAQEMETLEKQIMERLYYNNPYEE